MEVKRLEEVVSLIDTKISYGLEGIWSSSERELLAEHWDFDMLSQDVQG